MASVWDHIMLSGWLQSPQFGESSKYRCVRLYLVSGVVSGEKSCFIYVPLLKQLPKIVLLLHTSLEDDVWVCVCVGGGTCTCKHMYIMWQLLSCNHVHSTVLQRHSNPKHLCTRDEMVLLPYLSQLTESLRPVVCIEVIGECSHWRPVAMTKHLQRSMALSRPSSTIHMWTSFTYYKIVDTTHMRNVMQWLSTGTE